MASMFKNDGSLLSHLLIVASAIFPLLAVLGWMSIEHAVFAGIGSILLNAARLIVVATWKKSHGN